jgi:hydroxyethylthiazole kinase
MLWQDIQRIRLEAPLVHNITNFVVMNNTANALLALGASPVMAHAVEEVEEMAALARAVVINIGTLSPPWIEAMLKAGQAARRKGIPLILDPVGSGATRFRTQTVLKLLEEIPPTILRGNASEIRSLIHDGPGPKGVDSTHTSESILHEARTLSSQHRCVVVVSGVVDLVVAGDSIIRVFNGHPLMPRVTGLGCTATALTGAFAAINSSPQQAAAHAMALMGIAGEMAAEHSAGPGSLQMNFLDALYQIKESDILGRLKITES